MKPKIYKIPQMEMDFPWALVYRSKFKSKLRILRFSSFLEALEYLYIEYKSNYVER